MRVLCVCLGNICRSPMAEGVLRAKALAKGFDWQIDSAGTGSWHTGNPPDARGLSAALARGYDNSAQRARQVIARDFTAFDLILAMDENNLADLKTMAPSEATAKIRLFDPDIGNVPDPYYGGADGFERVLDQIENAADALINDHVG